ncbi:hypothetical protein CPC08DRAFT_625850 [Agrocybe pediades]|nr:hypothetical protein CPC08DRAFT_625850 [Agrocybe pediades]
MFLPSSVLLSLFAFSRLTSAIEVYLSPAPPFIQSSLSPEDASAALSRHIGLEAFESVWDTSVYTNNEEIFVGEGPKNVLIMTMDENDAYGILPHTFHHAFTVESPPSTEISSLSTVVSTYLHRASQEFTSIFSSFDFSSLQDVSSLQSFLDSAQEPFFVGIDLSALHTAIESDDEESAGVIDALHSMLESVRRDERFHLALLTYPSDSLTERATAQQTQAPLPSNLPPPHQPIGSVSTCFTSLDSCNNGTSTCSGRGQCVKASKAGKTCFVCNCGTTKVGEGNKVKTTYWAGESCERKDVSGPFVLLSGTVIVIILLIVGSISLLYGVGDQPLPSTLLATAVPAKKD